MSTSWTQTAGQICSSALEKMGVIEPGGTASASDMLSALNALDIVLVELPLRGYVWSALTAEAALAWVSGNTVTLPTDYYGNPVIWTAASGSRVQLHQFTQAEWTALRDTSPTGVVDSFYINPVGTCYIYPEPTVDPVLTIQYQRKTLDTSMVVAPDIPRTFYGALIYGVASELLVDYGVPDKIANVIEGNWREKKELALQSAIADAPISFAVRE